MNYHDCSAINDNNLYILQGYQEKHTSTAELKLSYTLNICNLFISFNYSISTVIHNHIPFTPAYGSDKVHERVPSIACYSSDKIKEYPHIVDQYRNIEEEISYTHIR